MLTAPIDPSHDFGATSSDSDAGPLHPLSQVLWEHKSADGPQLFERLQQVSTRGLPIPRAFVSQAPLVASSALMTELDNRIADLCAQLAPRLGQHDHGSWGSVPAADVLSVDLAIVQESLPDRQWGVRLVEIQAFTSVAATAHLLAMASQSLWPDLANLSCHGPAPKGWMERARTWLAPAEGTVLLDEHYWRQSTLFDFVALQDLFGLEWAVPGDLAREGSNVYLRQRRGLRLKVDAVHNRLIPLVRETEETVSSLFRDVHLHWHSHPAWFKGVSKETLCDMTLPTSERCVRATDWRSLGMAPQQLVLKACHSYAGADVHLGTSAAQLDALAQPNDWLVQPLYRPLALRKASNGEPVFAEVRCIVFLGQGHPWVGSRFARLHTGAKASASHFLNTEPSTGFAIVFNAPGCNWRY
jgi:hypothetical protein